jgi:DNA invertase Pin-like site-specific DNA recombinase
MSERDTRRKELLQYRQERRATDLLSPLFLGATAPKIRPEHQEKLAVVYIRQSTAHQVLEHGESRVRQYALTDYATRLGWARERVVVIDEDQGQSGQHAEGRQGFQRLLAEVTLDHVGLILALEMSRLARSDKDWHHLLELCAVFGTLLADQDGLYDAAEPNDRLLLGLKGTMSSLELHTMRNRLEKGRLSKAQRGELFLHVPMGYVKLPSGLLALDLDEQVRSVVQLIFDKFEELGSGRAVFRYLLRHDIRVGIRPHAGPNRGHVEWRRPSVSTVYSILHHPFYAGTYAYGRLAVDPKRKHAGHSKTGRRKVPQGEWTVMRRDQIPAYITWEQYLRNQDRLRGNCSRWGTRGPSREGAALLAGVLYCARCGTRMQVHYKTPRQCYYDCIRYQRLGLARTCRAVSAAALDTLVTKQLLRALQPVALELSLRAADDVERERARLTLHWHQQLERAGFEVLQAERRYRAVDAENRLVARTLEQQWEQALKKERQLKEEYDRFQRRTAPPLTREERERITALASDIPALWDAAGTSVVDRKEILRCLIERVDVSVRHRSEFVEVTLCWAGGFVSQHQVLRPIAGYNQLHDFDRLIDRLRELRRAGKNAAQIADRLNEEGFHPVHAARPFEKGMVRQLLSRWELSRGRNEVVELGPGEWWLSDLARHLKTSREKLRWWVRHGWVHCRRSPLRDYCILWADRNEVARLEKLRAHSDARLFTPYPAELTVPKRPPSRALERSQSPHKRSRRRGQPRDRGGKWRAQRNKG